LFGQTSPAAVEALPPRERLFSTLPQRLSDSRGIFAPPTVTVTPLFSGLTPTQWALSDNVTVPANVPLGSAVTVNVTVGSGTANTVNVAISANGQ